MFYYAYILISLKDNRSYIGYTTDLKKRLRYHNKGFNASTKNRRPLKLVYCEAYVEEQDARSRERFLKTGYGRQAVKSQLKYTLKNKNAGMV